MLVNPKNVSMPFRNISIDQDTAAPERLVVSHPGDSLHTFVADMTSEDEVAQVYDR